MNRSIWNTLVMLLAAISLAGLGACESKSEGGDEKNEGEESAEGEGAEGEGGEGEAAAEGEGAEGEGAPQGDENTEGDGAAPDEPAEEPEEAKAPLSPATYDGSEIQPSEFAAAFNPWKEKEIVIAAHPVFFFDEDELAGSVDLNMDPTTKDEKPANCTMKVDDEETFSKQKVAILKATFDKTWGAEYDEIHFKDCEKVELVDAMPERVEGLTAETYDGTTPIPLDQFMEHFFWTGKELTFVAKFNGSTTSKNKSGTSYRIDLQDTGDDLFDKHVSCYLEAELTEEEKSAGSQAIWKVTGTATGTEAFDRPELNPCKLVERVE